MVFTYQNNYPEGKLSSLMKLSLIVKDLISRMGLNFHAQSLFPLQECSKFHQLNSRRIKYIRMNTCYMVHHLKSVFSSNEVNIFPYQHNLFFTIEIASIIHRKDITQFIKNICSSFEKQNLNVRCAGSFGFDFIALDAYKDLSTGEERMRISPSDCPKTEITLFSKKFTDTLQDYLNASKS